MEAIGVFVVVSMGSNYSLILFVRRGEGKVTLIVHFLHHLVEISEVSEWKMQLES